MKEAGRVIRERDLRLEGGRRLHVDDTGGEGLGWLRERAKAG